MYVKNTMNEISFIKEIEKHECLYNHNLPEYNRREGSEQAWSEVAKSRNLTVAECKDKWRNIRSSLLRSLKRSEKPKKPYYLSPYLQFVLPFTKFRDECHEDTQRDNSQALQEGELELEIQRNPVKLEHESEDEHNPFEDVELFDTDMLSENLSTQRSTSPDDGASPIYRKHRRKLVSSVKRGSNKKSLKRNHSSQNTSSRGNSSLDNSSMRYFLLSLLPDFLTMSEEQIRMFKIKVMLLIDEIKSNLSEVQRGCRSSNDAQRLQKRLINLLLRNLKKNC